MTEILEKNIKHIRKYNSSLCDKVLAIKTLSKSFEINSNFVGEYNLVIDGIPVHSLTGAQQEAKDILENLPHNNMSSVHVLYGLGLGYLLDEFSQSVKGIVIVYEDDIELLRYVLEVVDFTSSFKNNNCYIVSNFDEYRMVFEHVFRYKTKVSLSALDYYILQRDTEYKAFGKEVERLYAMYDHNYSFQVHQIYSFLQQTMLCLDKKFNCPLLTDYKNLLKDKPAVIVSAGPSLARNIETLKKYKDSVYIFCVGTAFKTLIANGIVPDFLHVIEKVNTTIHYDSPKTKDIILVCEPYTSHYIYDLPFKNIFLTASEETDASRWFLDVAGKDFVPFETKGTVSYHALYSAMYLGCNSIILIGQDLAYSDGNCYAKGSAYEDLECFFDEKLNKYRIYPRNFEKYRDAYYAKLDISIEEKNERLNNVIEKFNSELVTVDGQNGEKLPTSNAYAMFIEYIKEFGIRFNSKCKLINSSLGGAQIDGFENMPLELALNSFAVENLDKSILKNSDFKPSFNIKEIILRLHEEIDAISEVYPLFIKGKEYVDKIKQELANRNTLTEDALKNLKKASTLYVDIANKYIVKNKLLKMAAMKEHCELSYLMKQNDFGSDLDFEAASMFLSAFDNYYFNVRKNLYWIWYMLKKNITELEAEK